MSKDKSELLPRFFVTIGELDPETGKTTDNVITAGADDLRDFTKLLKPIDREPGVRTELQKMFKVFKEGLKNGTTN